VSASLPAAPSLEQLRKQAKDLLRGHRAGDPGVAARVQAHHPHPDEPLKLSGAQLVVAREYGFSSWPRLRAYVDRVAAYGPELQHAFHEDLDYYEGRADGLLASAQDGTASAVAAFERRGAPLTRAGARAAVARAHGFGSWQALRRHVATLSEAGEPFARAYRAVEAHDADALRAELDRFPDLVAARGTNDNDLLGMAGGDERLVDLLLERGADPTRGNAHGWTPLHSAGYGNQPQMARTLLAAGARPDVFARGDGGTPLVVALFWGHREVSALLAEHGLHPRNLRVAAGLGRAELIDELAGTPAAGAHRGFYRPHGGFPAWQPSDDPQEVLDEALAWAARSDRADAIDALVAHGARLEADVYRGTPLMWAAASGRVAAIRRLVALGADPNGRSTFGGPEHGVGTVPLHLAAQGGHIAAIEALLDLGADPTVRDELHGGTPAGWAEHGCSQEAAELLRAHVSNERHPTSG
jgi:ankyrin repeat protein